MISKINRSVMKSMSYLTPGKIILIYFHLRSKYVLLLFLLRCLTAIETHYRHTNLLPSVSGLCYLFHHLVYQFMIKPFSLCPSIFILAYLLFIDVFSQGFLILILLLLDYLTSIHDQPMHFFYILILLLRPVLYVAVAILYRFLFHIIVWYYVFLIHIFFFRIQKIWSDDYLV